MTVVAFNFSGYEDGSPLSANGWVKRNSSGGGPNFDPVVQAGMTSPISGGKVVRQPASPNTGGITSLLSAPNSPVSTGFEALAVVRRGTLEVQPGVAARMFSQNGAAGLLRNNTIDARLMKIISGVGNSVMVGPHGLSDTLGWTVIQHRCFPDDGEWRMRVWTLGSTRPTSWTVTADPTGEVPNQHGQAGLAMWQPTSNASSADWAYFAYTNNKNETIWLPGESGYVAPTDPATLTHTINDKDVTLTWSNPVTAGATHVDVFHRTPSTGAAFNPNTATRTARVPIGTNSYVLSNLANGSYDAQVFPFVDGA